MGYNSYFQFFMTLWRKHLVSLKFITFYFLIKFLLVVAQEIHQLYSNTRSLLLFELPMPRFEGPIFGPKIWGEDFLLIPNFSLISFSYSFVILLKIQFFFKYWPTIWINEKMDLQSIKFWFYNFIMIQYEHIHHNVLYLW